ncbi:MAG: hypothetical protein ACXIUV_05470 [Alkalilacustris sp.]
MSGCTRIWAVRARGGLLGLVLGLLPATAGADCALRGRVLSGGLGLAGVEVMVQLAGQREHRVGVTDAQGHYAGHAPKPPARTSMTLIYRRHGFHEVNRVRAETGACPPSDLPEVAMEPVGQAGAAAVGLTTTVLVAPYALYGGVSDEDRQRFNETLDQIIGHRILSFRSGLQVQPLPPEPSVRRHAEPLSMVDRERIRSAGADARAMAVIIGEGELVDIDGAEMFALSSEFVVIARHPAWQELRLAVEDRLPRADARPSQLSRNLTDFWGQRAMIALIVRELDGLPNPPPPERLDEIRRWLVELRGTMTADNPLLRELTQLLEAVAEAEGPT